MQIFNSQRTWIITACVLFLAVAIYLGNMNKAVSEPIPELVVERNFDHDYPVLFPVAMDGRTLTVYLDDLDKVVMMYNSEVEFTWDVPEQVTLTRWELGTVIYSANRDNDLDDCYLIANEILYWSDHYGYTNEDIPFILGLFYNESRFDHEIENDISSATGVGQLTRMWWDGNDPKDIEFNVGKSFELLAHDCDEGLDRYECWRVAFWPYCRSWQGVAGALSHVDYFKAMLEEYS